MFKGLKTSNSTGGGGMMQQQQQHQSGDASSTPTARPSSYTSTSNSRLTRSTSALELLQQQRRQTNANGNTFPSRQHPSTSYVQASSLPVRKSKSSVPSSLPVTARKKSKPAAKEAAVAAATAIKEQDTSTNDAAAALPTAASEASVMRDDTEDDSLPDDGADSTDAATQNVVVCVRVRPSSAKDTSEAQMWQLDGDAKRIMPTSQHPTLSKRSTAASSTSDPPAVADDGAYDFRFDALVLPTQSADDMYTTRIAPIVDAVTKGYNGTVFAYGQTGSGKTFTMSGSESEKGVIPKAIDQIFADVQQQTASREFLLRVSYMEIYNETLNDLLAGLASGPSKASSKEDENGRPSSPIKGGSSHVVMTANGTAASTTTLRMFESAGRVQIQGLREEIVTSAADVLDLLQRGQALRHQAATDWNERSSRSHCVFILTVESRAKGADGPQPGGCGGGGGGGGGVRLSQLNLIDLAGSERAASEKDRRKEGAFINKSLLTLGTVIAKLSEKHAAGSNAAATTDMHIPYRDSKLTRLLQASLGGNARVAVVCTLSAGAEHATESLSTLRFGQRCQMVVTRAKQGSVVDDKALIARYRRELEKLRGQLDAGGVAATQAGTTTAADDDPSIKALHDEKERAERDVRDMNAKRDDLRKQIEHLTKLILTGKNVEADSAARPSMILPTGGDDVDERAGDKTRRIRAARRSDMGTSSPSKRPVPQFSSPHTLTPLAKGQENMGLPSGKPFAMESELAAMRKSLAKAMSARQASEDARRQEVQLWQAKVTELEEVNKEQEEELDEAEEAFNKLKQERETMKQERDATRAKVHEEQEANRLLKLVAKSRTGGDSSDELRKVVGERDAKIKELSEALKAAKVEQQAAEEMKVEMEALKAQATQHEPDSAAQIAELERQLEDSTYHDAGDADEELRSLREQLSRMTEEKERLEKDMQHSSQERNREDAERDFADLMQDGKADEATDALRKELEQVKERLAEQMRENEQLRITSTAPKPLPVPSVSASPSMSFDLRSTMEKQLRKAEERCKTLEAQVDALKSESFTARDIASASPPLSSYSASSSSSSTTGSRHSPAVVELQIESDNQKARIASLERQMAESRARLQEAMSGSASLPGSPLKWSSSSNSPFVSQSNPATPVRRGAGASNRLHNLREDDEADDGEMTLQPGPFGAFNSAKAGRSGSMREFKRGNAGGDLASPARSLVDMERQSKEDRKEIARLNSVISTQRSIMADLEASVATWKRRLRTQQDIIKQLVEAGGKSTPSLLAKSQGIVETPPMTNRTADFDSGADLKRASSSASSASSASTAPYYGAHIYNRPPVAGRQGAAGAAQGLGLGSTSPTKGSSWLSTMPGVRPDPLPLPDSYAVGTGLSSPSSKGALRRKTIEHDLQSLKGSPRIESVKSRLLDSTTNYAPPPQQRTARPLPVPGSPAKLRASKDWYI